MVQARVLQIPMLPVVFCTGTQRWDSVGRLLDLVERIMALVYHVREPSEWPSLQETIEASVQTGEHRQEGFEVRRTIADMLKDEGWTVSRRRRRWTKWASRCLPSARDDGRYPHVSM